ncbi:MAG: hypothetical protein ABL891_00165 [Burkholderiales bacterium]
MKLSRTSVIGLALIAGGCSTIEGSSSKGVLIPSQTINVTNALHIPLESIAAGALLFVIIDPLAPNWHIEQMRVGESRFRISMRKKRFTTGGDGEVMPAFHRRAEQIAIELGSRHYRVVEFTEGIDSVVPIAQRVAQGIVEIVR